MDGAEGLWSASCVVAQRTRPLGGAPWWETTNNIAAPLHSPLHAPCNCWYVLAVGLYCVFPMRSCTACCFLKLIVQFSRSWTYSKLIPLLPLTCGHIHTPTSSAAVGGCVQVRGWVHAWASTYDLIFNLLLVDLPKHDYLFSRRWSASMRMAQRIFRQCAQLCKLRSMRAGRIFTQTSKQQWAVTETCLSIESQCCCHCMSSSNRTSAPAWNATNHIRTCLFENTKLSGIHDWRMYLLPIFRSTPRFLFFSLILTLGNCHM